MGLRLDIKKALSSRSDRVKCVDFHPVEPWILVSLYNGQVHIWNYETQILVKSFEICELPTRTGRFIARKNWFIVGSDDMQLRVFNYNTHEKVHSFEAHSDYIRCLAVHPTQPYVLSSADDMLIKLWDWDKQWKNIMTFEGHSHYVMCAVFNPKDTNTFATASLDKTIKVWNLGSSVPNFTLEGHQKGVNWVDYYHGGEKPFLVTGADDKTVKVWDYQNKTCVQTLEGHSQNVCVVAFHPELPLIVSGSEDGTVRLWHSNTYRLENTLNYGFERVWTLCQQRGSNCIGIGYDEGTVVIKLGREDPVVSMDTSGKLIWAKHNEIQTAHIQPADLASLKDGDRVQLAVKDLGNSEVFPQTLQHSPNGRFAVVCGDGEYIIYTALSWRNKSFGSALEFVWAPDSNEYAVRESSYMLKTFKSFKERHSIKTFFSAEAIYGGTLLGVRGSSFLCFYDWNSGVMVRRIDVQATNVFWSDGGLLCICTADQYYILRYNAQAVDEAVSAGSPLPDEGVEAALEVVSEISEGVKNGCWIGDCFIYITASNRLNYLVGGQVNTVSHFDNSVFLLGYMPKDNKVFVCDKDLNVYAYNLALNLLEYQTAILRRDFATAESLLPSLPNDQRNRVARFLESLDLKELALSVTTDPEHRFDLAIQLRKVNLAHQLAQQADNEQKWRQVAEYAFAEWNLPLAEECLKRAKDLPGLLMIYTAIGDQQGLIALAEQAGKSGKRNIEFTCHYLCGQLDKCLELLLATDRIAEAAFFARTYLPSQVPRVVQLWRDNLQKSGQVKSSESIADPLAFENLFPSYKYSLVAEMKMQAQRANGAEPASAYGQWKSRDPGALLAAIQEQFPDPSAGLPPVADLLATAESAYRSSAATAGPQMLIQPPATPPPKESQPPKSQSPSKPAAPTPLPSVALSKPPPVPIPAAAAANNNNNNNNNTTNFSSSVSNAGSSSLGGEEMDTISDNMSHLSMEVNTTGTRSVRGDMESQDLDQSNLYDVSFSSLSTTSKTTTAAAAASTVNRGTGQSMGNLISLSPPPHVQSHQQQQPHQSLLSSSPSLSSPQPQQQQQPQQQHFGTATLSSGLTASGGASAETTLNLDIIDELVDPDLQQFASESRFHSAAGSPDKSVAATSTGSQPPASPSKYPSSTGDDELDEILNM